MANEFIEVRLDHPIEYGSSYRETYVVDITDTASSNEYRVLKVPIPQRYFSLSMNVDNADYVEDVLDIFSVCYGRYAGFRYKCWDDFSSALNGIGALAPTDQTCLRLSQGVYQLQKEYGRSKTALGTIGRPKRTIYKPVSGTTRIAIGSREILNTPVVNWAVSTTDGKVTFSTNKTAAVSAAITKAASAVIPCTGHTFVVGNYVHISGCVGMTQINGLRGLVTAIVAGVSITVDINSTAFGTWTSGGTLNSQPQSTETVYAGFEFDYPVRFNSDLNVSQVDWSNRLMDSMALKELISL